MKSQQNDPIYSQISQVKDAVAEVLEHAKKLGATAAAAAMSSTSGSVSYPHLTLPTILLV